MNANQLLTYAGHSHDQTKTRLSSRDKNFQKCIHRDKYGAYYYFINKGLGPSVQP